MFFRFENFSFCLCFKSLKSGRFTKFDESKFQHVGWSQKYEDFITHKQPSTKNTAGLEFEIELDCNPGETVKVEALLAQDMVTFLYDIEGVVTC